MFTFNHDIFSVLYNQSLILLDVEQNKYLVLNDEASDICVTAVKYNTIAQNIISPQILEQLVKAGILLNDPSGKILGGKIISQGIFDAYWQIPYGDLDISTKAYSLFEAYMCLIYVHRLVKKHKFKGIIKVFEKLKSRYKPNLYPSISECRDLEVVINKACFWYHSKVKCLEWSVACLFLALRKGWKVKLIVGVQNYPFLAHAWIQNRNYIIGNNQEISSQLGHILTLSTEMSD